MPAACPCIFFGHRLILRRFDRNHVYALAFSVKLHAAFGQGENREIATKADIQARVKFGAALTNDDVARNDALAAKTFDAKAFADAVAVV